jgi:hypothetical protein
MGSLGGLSPGGSIAVCHCGPPLAPTAWDRTNANGACIDWYNSWSYVDERSIPWTHTSTKITYPRRRERTARRTPTAASTTEMAAGHGHVRGGERSREQYTDIDVAIARTVNTTSSRPGFQLDMCDFDIKRALYKMESMGYITRF